MKADGHNDYYPMSMGGGQNDKAMQLVKQARQSGYWVCLKNVHLVVVWLKELEKELRDG